MFAVGRVPASARMGGTPSMRAIFMREVGERAMILVTYGVDKAVYDNPRSIHNIALTTTMYTFRTETLVHLQFGTLFRNKLENRLRVQLGANEQFMLDKGNGSIEAVTRNEFQEKRERFDSAYTVKEQEALESYCYTDKRNRQEIVQIAISIKGDSMEAVIDFKNTAQYENFVQPAWLICL